jgi:uncharacterized Zn finger protein
VPSVADLVEPSVLDRLAGGAELDAARVLADRGAVRLVEFGPLRVVADVFDEGRSGRVSLESREGTLEWACTCPGVTAGACRHVAAAGLATWRKSPRKRG